MLKVEEITVGREHTFLSDVPFFKDGIPTNCIFFKTIPGFGATFWELIYRHRASLIMVPNVPVLIGKRDKRDDDGELLHPNILVVYQDVTLKDVLDYLESDTVPKKIMFTPEAYESKVKEAIKQSQYNLFGDFFFLVDECDRLIKDVSFREKIILPMDDFFKFNSKAMVSATALEPTDKRFEANDFKIVKLKPNYDYSRPLSLISTDNITASFNRLLNENDGERFFVFTNSITLSETLITTLGIKDRSTIYASENGKRKHWGTNINMKVNISHQFEDINFLTSRFFSAVDIDVDYKPIVVIITDVVRFPNTVLDPYTDCIQIAGRLRNGTKKLIHLTNYFSDIHQYGNPEEFKALLTESFEAYRAVQSQIPLMESEQARLCLEEMLKSSPIESYVHNGEINTYMVDNKLLDMKVERYYRNRIALGKAYNDVRYFKVDMVDWTFGFSDRHQMQLGKSTIFKDKCESVALLLEFEKSNKFVYSFGMTALEARKMHPDIARYFDELGYEKLKGLAFDKQAIERAIAKLTKKTSIDSSQVRERMLQVFKGVDRIEESVICEKIRSVFNEFGIVKKPSANIIEKWFKITRISDKGIKYRKFNGIQESSVKANVK